MAQALPKPEAPCETFAGVVKAGPHDPTYKGGEHADTTRDMVDALIRALRLDNVTVLQGMFPDETAHLIEGRCFRFCHIDVDLYQSAKDIMDWVWDKMVIGGIVVFDDYGFATEVGIRKYVDEQRPSSDRVVIHNLNGHAVLVKVS